jgi:amino acid adenylation domain-containing protein
MKAGGTFVPLEPSQPVARLQDICRRTNANLILSSVAHAPLSRTLAGDVIEVGDHIRSSNQGPVILPNVDPEQPAYILFTSGTTGAPKGAMVSHSSYSYAAETHIRAFSLDHTSRVLQFSSYSFDVSVMQILTTLIAGATVCVISEPEQSQMMLNGTCPFSVTHAFLTPSLAGGLDATKASWVQTMVLLGEPMSASHITQWGRVSHLINAYGPTECAVVNTVSPRLFRGCDPRNIGWGLGIHCWVVDQHDHHKLLPIGAVGELILSGPSVGRGYLNQPERTAEAFIEPPGWLRALYPEEPSYWRLYKTGDLVQYEISDGSLRFEGRKDRQIKVRGQRVELEEIEYHTRRCFPGAKEAVVEQVMVPEDPTPGPSTAASAAVVPRLVACIWTGSDDEPTRINGTMGDGGPTEEDILRAPSPEFHAAAAATLGQLRDALPGYMVPDLFVPIIQVPRTTSGKTDRQRLREHIRAIQPEDWRAYAAVQRSKRPVESETAIRLHAILTGLLNLPPEEVGADDSFFQLGGDSILAMKMAANARAEGLEISPHDILRHPTILEWANIVEANRAAPSAPKPYFPHSLVTDAEQASLLSSYFAQDHPFTPDNVQDIVPVVESQSFYITHTSPVSMAELFPNSLDLDRLRRACSRVVSHFSILRTVFVGVNNRFFQAILREVEPVFDLVECEDPEAYIAQESKRQLTPSTPQGAMPVSFTVVTSHTRPDWVFIVRI